jgi:hypothetical protein
VWLKNQFKVSTSNNLKSHALPEINTDFVKNWLFLKQKVAKLQTLKHSSHQSCKHFYYVFCVIKESNTNVKFKISRLC